MTSRAVKTKFLKHLRKVKCEYVNNEYGTELGKFRLCFKKIDRLTAYTPFTDFIVSVEIPYDGPDAALRKLVLIHQNLYKTGLRFNGKLRRVTQGERKSISFI